MSSNSDSKTACAVSSAILVALLAGAAAAAYYFLYGFEMNNILFSGDDIDHLEEHVGCRHREDSIKTMRYLTGCVNKTGDMKDDDNFERLDISRATALNEMISQNYFLNSFGTEQFQSSNVEKESNTDMEALISLTFDASHTDLNRELKSIPKELFGISNSKNKRSNDKISSTQHYVDGQNMNSNISVPIPYSEIDSYMMEKIIQDQNFSSFKNYKENYLREQMRIRHPLKWYNRNIRAAYTKAPHEYLNNSNESEEFSRDIESTRDRVSQSTGKLLSNTTGTQSTTSYSKRSKWKSSHINRRRCRERKRRLENAPKMEVVVAVDYIPPNTPKVRSLPSARFNLRWPSVRKCLKHVVNDWTLDIINGTRVFIAKTKYANTLTYCLTIERKRYQRLLDKFSTMEGCISSKKAKKLQQTRSKNLKNEEENNKSLGLTRKTRQVMKRRHKRRRKRHYAHKFKVDEGTTSYDILSVTTRKHDSFGIIHGNTSTKQLESREVISKSQISNTTKIFDMERRDFQKILVSLISENKRYSPPSNQVNSSYELHESSKAAVETAKEQILGRMANENILSKFHTDRNQLMQEKVALAMVSLLLKETPMKQIFQLIDIGKQHKRVVETFFQIILQIISQNIPIEDILNSNQSLYCFLRDYIPNLVSSILTKEIKEKIFNDHPNGEEFISVFGKNHRKYDGNKENFKKHESLLVNNSLSTTNNEKLSHHFEDKYKSHPKYHEEYPMYSTNVTAVIVERKSSQEASKGKEKQYSRSRSKLCTSSEDNKSHHESLGIQLSRCPREVAGKSKQEEENKAAYGAILTEYVGRILQRLPVADIIGDSDEASEGAERVPSKMEDITSYVQKALERIPVEAISRNINSDGQNKSTIAKNRDALINYIRNLVEKPIVDELNRTSKNDTKAVPFDHKVLWKYIHGLAQFISDRVEDAEKPAQDIQLLMSSESALNISMKNIFHDIKYLIELEKKNHRMKLSQNENADNSTTNRTINAKENNSRAEGKYPIVLSDPSWKNNSFPFRNIPKKKNDNKVPDSELTSELLKKKNKTNNLLLESSRTENMDEARKVSYHRAKRDVNTNQFTESTQTLREFFRKLNMKSEKLKLERLERMNTNIDESNRSLVTNASYKIRNKISGFKKAYHDNDTAIGAEKNSASGWKLKDNEWHTQRFNSEGISETTESSLQREEASQRREKHEVPRESGVVVDDEVARGFGSPVSSPQDERGSAPVAVAVASCGRDKAVAASDAEDAAIAVALLSLGLFTAAVFVLKVSRTWGGARRLVSLWSSTTRNDSTDEAISYGHVVERGQKQNSSSMMLSKKGDSLILKTVFFIEVDGGGEQLPLSIKKHVSRSRTLPVTLCPNRDTPSYEQRHRSHAPSRPVATHLLGIPALLCTQPHGTLPPSPRCEMDGVMPMAQPI